MNLFAQGEGNTPLSAEEQADLIPNLATKEELNEWERQNILEAYAWALAPNNLRRNDRLVEPYVRDLHRRMFDQTWRWAGVYRTSEKNIGVRHHEIRERLAGLLGDARYWLEHGTYVAENGLNLTSDVLEKVRKPFESPCKKMGGNRFVDELDFHHVNEALKNHSPWRDFLHKNLGKSLSNGEYGRLFNFTDFRDAVMHGRVSYPTYWTFHKHSSTISQIGELIDNLDAYRSLHTTGSNAEA